MQYTARVALLRLDESRADAALRSNLREQAAGHGELPDWSTLEVSEPVEVEGASGHVWYRWGACVEGRPSPRRPRA
ncbi:hypothetical protein [Blastococcus sp. TF02A-26]|uniref:hypothetical protein n=1 Tax=Blastococcus sp. TF02A-26 TaxID=2250577 RepID=UPI000DE8AC65|nr:hypothetical protein [Blastococcus sp. TF02A-26]RBY83374.1 hypothetical protein DQ240_16945 [Blastococcus sp. TF02A-26]